MFDPLVFDYLFYEITGIPQQKIRIGRGGAESTIRRAATGGAVNRMATAASVRRGAIGRR